MKDKKKKINLKPPASARSAAKKGLELRKKYKRGGFSNKQANEAGVGSGVQRASDIVNGENLSATTVKRMKSFFARHEKNKSYKRSDGKAGPSNGYIAWQLWGGDAGRSWANKKVKEIENAKKKNNKKKK